ncbi:MAG: hypothetical protein GTO05_18020, partial [Gemmatimonadales bacterium]|nr:hypothetical protein [Gemmatimonadales bacterium]
VAALVVAVVVTVLLWPRGEPEVSLDAAAGELAAGELRVAVLPFTPHGMGVDDEGLPVGVAQLLNLQLEQLGVVEMVAHRAVLQHWGESGLATAGGFNPSTLKSLAEALGAS